MTLLTLRRQSRQLFPTWGRRQRARWVWANLTLGEKHILSASNRIKRKV
jgi:hypothetical protein